MTKKRTKGQCGDCGVYEGEVHIYGCDMDVCPFCGGQLLSCGCCDRYSTSDIRPNLDDTWIDALEKKGIIPYIEYPVLCVKCGETYPDFFHVPTKEWEFYVQPDMRHEVICRDCYEFIKAVTDEADAAK